MLPNLCGKPPIFLLQRFLVLEEGLEFEKWFVVLHYTGAFLKSQQDGCTTKSKDRDIVFILVLIHL